MQTARNAERSFGHMAKMFSWTTWDNAKLSVPLRQKGTQIVSRCWSCKATNKNQHSSRNQPICQPPTSYSSYMTLFAANFSNLNAHGLVIDGHHPIAKLWLLMETESMHFRAALARKWDLPQTRDVLIITASCHVCGAFTFDRTLSKESREILRQLRFHIKH